MVGPRNHSKCRLDNCLASRESSRGEDEMGILLAGRSSCQKTNVISWESYATN